MSETPELDRMIRLREDGITPTLENFTFWLEEQGIRFMRYQDTLEDRMCITCSGTGCVSVDNDDPMAGWATGIPEKITKDCDFCTGTGYTQHIIGHDWYEESRSKETLFADFLGISLTEIDRERRALLDDLRRLNSGG